MASGLRHKKARALLPCIVEMSHLGGTTFRVVQFSHSAYTLPMIKSRLIVCLTASFLLVACESTMPTPEQLDALERQVRAEHRQESALLEERRRSGQMTPLEYEMEHVALERRIQNKVDSMVWNRHALAQSELKANDMPTPDRPVANPPPGVGGIQNSLYNSARQTGMGNQVMGNFLGDFGGTNYNSSRAGTNYDP